MNISTNRQDVDLTESISFCYWYCSLNLFAIYLNWFYPNLGNCYRILRYTYWLDHIFYKCTTYIVFNAVAIVSPIVFGARCISIWYLWMRKSLGLYSNAYAQLEFALKKAMSTMKAPARLNSQAALLWSIIQSSICRNKIRNNVLRRSPCPAPAQPP